jgi:hypothetical protein
MHKQHFELILQAEKVITCPTFIYKGFIVPIKHQKNGTLLKEFIVSSYSCDQVGNGCNERRL